MKHVESQVKRRPDDDSFNGPDSTKSDQEYNYICMPKNDKSNDKEVVKGNKKGSPDLEAEDVSEIWAVEVATEALETIGYQDVLQIEK